MRDGSEGSGRRGAKRSQLERVRTEMSRGGEQRIVRQRLMFPLVESSEHQRKKQIRNQTEVECVRVRVRAGKRDVASGKGSGLRQLRIWSDLFFC